MIVHPAAQAVENYNAKNAPSIAVPREEHIEIPKLTGQYDGTARDLLAKDIKDLRNNSQAPNSSLQELIKQNKEMYPEALSKTTNQQK